MLHNPAERTGTTTLGEVPVESGADTMATFSCPFSFCTAEETRALCNLGKCHASGLHLGLGMTALEDHSAACVEIGTNLDIVV